MDNIVLRATEGNILTNGKIYGRTIYLPSYLDPADFYEIPEEEYFALIQSEEEIVEE